MANSHYKGGLVISLTSLCAVLVVLLFTLVSIAIVNTVRTVIGLIVYSMWFVGEVFIALVAALTSGTTITLSVIMAAVVTSYTLPPSYIETRILVSVCVAGCSIASAAIAVICFTTIKIHAEVMAGIVTAASFSVALAAAWAVGVMSLIERETQTVGLKLTSILDAVRHNNHRVLRFLVKLHAGLTQRDLDLALLHAVKVGFPECTEILLGAGASIEARDSHDNTPIILACETGSIRISKILWERGRCDVNARNGHRTTALHHVAKWGYMDCLDYLLSHGADPNVQDGQWRTPLMLAAGHAHRAGQVMEKLLDTGAQVNRISMNQLTALHFAVSRGLDIQILLDAGADVKARDGEQNSSLHMAAREGEHRMVSKLLELDCDPNSFNMSKRTPLHLAAMKGNMDSIRVLIDASSDPFAVDNHTQLPIHYAVSHGHLRAVQYFITHNVPLGPSIFNGDMVDFPDLLQIALERKYFGIAKVLVLAGSDSKPLSKWLNEMPASVYEEFYNRPYVDWFKSYLSNTQYLSDICRLQIRASIGQKLHHKVQELPLPLQIKQFILMSDLDDSAPMLTQWEDIDVPFVTFEDDDEEE